MEDQFAHSVMPPRPSSPRSGAVILLAAVILVLGVLVALFWTHLFPQAPSSALVSPNTGAPPPAPPLTQEEKQQALAQGSSTDMGSTTPALSAQSKEQALQTSNESDAPPQPQLSAEEKMKLLGSQ